MLRYGMLDTGLGHGTECCGSGFCNTGCWMLDAGLDAGRGTGCWTRDWDAGLDAAVLDSAILDAGRGTGSPSTGCWTWDWMLDVGLGRGTGCCGSGFCNTGCWTRDWDAGLDAAVLNSTILVAGRVLEATVLNAGCGTECWTQYWMLDAMLDAGWL